MKYDYGKFHNSINLSHVTLYVYSIWHTNLSHWNMGELLNRVETSTKYIMMDINENNINLVFKFPMLVLEPEFIIPCVKNFNCASRIIRDQVVIPSLVCILTPMTRFSRYHLLSWLLMYLEKWNSNMQDYIKYVNKNYLI